MTDRNMIFRTERFETSSLDEFGSSLNMVIGMSTAQIGDDIVIPQIEVEVLNNRDERMSIIWINADKIDEVITMLAYAKHRITEETGYGTV